METLLESLGPIILAFIVLIYYGLRAMFRPRRDGEATAEDNYFLTEPLDAERTKERPRFETGGFVFSDPINDPVSDNHTGSHPSSDQPKKQPPATQSTVTAEKNNIFTSLFPTAADLIADRVEERYAPPNEAATSKPRKPRPPSSPSPYATTVPYEPAVTLRVKPPIPAQERRSQALLLAKKRLNLRNELKIKLSHPTLKQQTLRETLFLNEILSKPLALRDRNAPPHF